MRLSRIEIENFKGIAAAQVIDLKPITLLFGPNSAGKSTILQSLHYLREILERRNADPDQTIAGGLIDLGGFATLVHGHDLSRTIVIKVVIDGVDGHGTERLPLNSGASLTAAEFETLPIRYLVGENTDLKDYAVVQSIGVSLSISWSDLLAGPYVSAITVMMDGAEIGTIASPAQSGQAILSKFNFDHNLFRRFRDGDELPDAEDELSQYPLADEILDLSRQMSKNNEVQLNDYRVGVETFRGALPDLSRPMVSDLRDPDIKKFEFESRSPRVGGLNALLDELIVGPLRLVRDYLSAMTYVGPLREIPSRKYRPRLSPDESRWAQGLAAWDLLYTDPSGKLLEEVNAWLGGEERLKTGYRLEKFEFKEVSVPSRFHQLFERGLSEDDLGELQDLYATLSRRSEIALRDFEKGIIVAPSDVGVGISQMIPVIVGCLRGQQGILAIEQPELHVHPAIQVGLGDLFIQAVQTSESMVGAGKTLLVETHSEHIMLRLLRRIRETTENEVPPGVIGLSRDDLSVIYVESGDGGVRFRPLRVDPEGEFIDRWPKGFFEERAEELF
ncbi:putative ATPase [Tardiphaga robiniae]|uniref:AAA family ATPase n=1 Tax=Tardiphaga robiniae TaxID=943830 RepID=UPI00285DA1C6|nr:AAA family ATPase [Tardiphaga robiniae]MDR6657582.1 putative ATPase [Tardiphaga robiniae]